MKNIFKDILTKNIGLKLLSIILALLVWLIIMNVEDPTITVTIEDIPVQVINEEVVTSRGYGYTIESGEKVDVRVKGRRALVDNLTAEDFDATADFNSFNSMYMAPISVACKSPSADEMTITLRNEQMAVKLEDQATESVNIRLIINGSVKEGYYLFDRSVDIGLVQVTGAASQVAAVKEAVAEVDIEGVNASFETDAVLYAIDEQGEKIDSKKISLSQDTAKVTFVVTPIKEVALSVKTVGNPADYHYIDKIEFAPQKLQITGDPKILGDIEELVVPCDISGASENVERQVNMEQFIEDTFGNKCLVVDQTRTMGIIATINKMQETRFAVKAENIELRGTRPDEFEYTIYSLWSSDVVVRGRDEDMTNVELSDLHLYLDMTDIEPGTHSLSLKTEYNGELLVSLGNVSVLVERKPAPPVVINQGPAETNTAAPAEEGI